MSEVCAKGTAVTDLASVNNGHFLHGLVTSSFGHILNCFDDVHALDNFAEYDLYDTGRSRRTKRQAMPKTYVLPIQPAGHYSSDELKGSDRQHVIPSMPEHIRTN